MSISNLHSLFNRPWYIELDYGISHLPILFNLLDGKKIEVEIDDNDNPDYFSFIDLNGNDTNRTSENKKAAILNIKYPIVKHDQMCGPQGTKSMMRQLDSLKSNDSIAGVVLDVDSGGGQSYGTPEFYDYIMNYPKPIVSYTDGFMCSAAYYLSAASDHIVANKRAEAIGSIGAYSQILDLTGFYKKQGAKLHTIYGTKSTKKNKSYREVLKGNYNDYIKEELDPLIETFINDMKSARPMISEEVFKGSTYNGPAAKEMGLVDEIGTIQTAIDKVFELSDKNNKSKNNTMSKLDIPFIEEAIGAEFSEGETEHGIILTDNQALELESYLKNTKAALDKSKTKTTELTDSQDSITSVLTEALKEAEVENPEKLSTEEGIQKLSELVKEYGSKDGAEFTRVPETTDTDDDSENNNIIGGIDISAALNN